jgi:transcriptional regulator with XRE-family HTH domain
MDEKQVGKNIKKIRKEKGLSLQQLADMINLTKGYISKIEHSDSAPPLSTLNKIANALNVELSVLTSDKMELPGEVRLCLTRKGEGRMLSTGTMQGYHYELLAHKKIGKNMEPFILYPAFTEEAVFSHEGEEFMYTMEGSHEITYGDEKYILNEGDSIYYDSIVPHTGRSIGKKKARVLTVSYSYKRESHDIVDMRITRRIKND